MKKSIFLKSSALALLALFSLSSCSKKSNGPEEENKPVDAKFVVMTSVSDLDRHGYLSAYSTMPSGPIKNDNSNSLQVNAAFGFRVYNKAVYTGSNPAGEAGLQKYTIKADNSFATAGFIANAGMYTIVDDQTGFYTDAVRGLLKIQKFNPATMQRTGEIDLSSLKKDGIQYQVVGKHILAVKEGKLYAGITYGTTNGQGWGDDVVEYVEIAVVDIATGNLDKTIKYDGLKSLGYGAGANKMWTVADDGALYFCSTGISSGFTSSAVIRIKKGETDFDRSWSIKGTDYQSGTASSFGFTLIKNGKMYVQFPTEALKADFSNLNNGIWDYYVIDMTTKVRTKISGMPKTNYVYGRGQAIYEMDNKIYFVAEDIATKTAAYYVLGDNNTATLVFNINGGGRVWDVARMD